MIWGMSFDDSFEDEVKVTIIATWFNEQASSKIKTVRTNTRGDPIRKPASDGFTRIVNDWWFTSSNVEGPDLTNDAFRAPDNSDEDWEMPAFMKKQLGDWETPSD
jgi:hypothetical protein